MEDKKTIIDCSTGEISFEKFTDKEKSEQAIKMAFEQKRYAKEKKEAEAKAAAKSALLEKLGITADEAKLLLS